MREQMFVGRWGRSNKSINEEVCLPTMVFVSVYPLSILSIRLRQDPHIIATTKYAPEEILENEAPMPSVLGLIE